MTDIEIQNCYKKKPINVVAKKYGINKTKKEN